MLFARLAVGEERIHDPVGLALRAPAQRLHERLRPILPRITMPIVKSAGIGGVLNTRLHGDRIRALISCFFRAGKPFQVQGKPRDPAAIVGERTPACLRRSRDEQAKSAQRDFGPRASRSEQILSYARRSRTKCGPVRCIHPHSAIGPGMTSLAVILDERAVHIDAPGPFDQS
ncbi:hypothetical protein [Nannocystis radixulma]|uniref:Uncharacterized protein n=1 Tax=Nannocystis radixulma TaxID=2995305 RepID=A0ABT5B1K7_9BACT|nr:hypothetical protein [Nannocystis radixulma]MDC0667997.1 hypothetical protein [Nannocystis radixulma]